jgi:hypothetical protein
MLARFEDRAAIGALTFEDARGVMQTMRKDVKLGFAPGDKPAIIPDESVALIEGRKRHGELREDAIEEANQGAATRGQH